MLLTLFCINVFFILDYIESQSLQILKQDQDNDDNGLIYQRYDSYIVCSNLGFKKEDLQSAFAKNNSKLKSYILTF